MEKKELPVEVLKDIEALVMDKTLHLPNNNDFDNGYEKGMERGIEIGATAYANKLQTAEGKIKLIDYDNQKLKGECEGLREAAEELKRQNEKMRLMTEGWRPLLEEFISMHESGLLPNRFTYEKAKKFLYGE
jgi:FtsZ-binding cell division protein ZapB